MMSSKQALRRLLVTPMPSGVIGLGYVGNDDELRTEVIERKGPLSLGDCMLMAVSCYEPEEIIALLPGEGVNRDYDADRYVHSVLIGLACPRTSVVHSWRDFRRMQDEHASDSNINGKHFASYVHEILWRLHALQRCCALFDVRLGEDMPFTDEAVAARWEIAVEAAASEQQRRIAAEQKLAEAERIIDRQRGMIKSLQAALTNPTSH